MKKLAVIVAVLLALYGCWELTFPSATWRYRLTLIVDDNGKQVTGSGVIQASIRNSPRFLQEISHSMIHVKGEAVSVDLGEKGTLFALLKKDDNNDYGFYIVPVVFPYPEGITSKGLNYYSHLKGKKRLRMPDELPSSEELTPERQRFYANSFGKDEIKYGQIPMLVRFRDINDPKTVEKVDPKDLEKNFGPGVKLISATIEMTDDPVTRGIEKRLSWIKEYYDRRLDGNRYGSGDAKNRLANDLSSGAFSTELSPHGR